MNKINDTFVEKEERMKRYLEEIKPKIIAFEMFKIKQIPRRENVHTNSLVTLTYAVNV